MWVLRAMWNTRNKTLVQQNAFVRNSYYNKSYYKPHIPYKPYVLSKKTHRPLRPTYSNNWTSKSSNIVLHGPYIVGVLIVILILGFLWFVYYYYRKLPDTTDDNDLLQHDMEMNNNGCESMYFILK